MTQMVFGQGLANRLDVMYRSPDMLRRRELARAALAAAPGERIVDLGCGPGFYVAELLKQVGPGGHVVGIDASPAMLALAAARCAGPGHAAFLRSGVASLPAASERFDAALCVQVLEYVPDVAAALAEARRVLRPGGRLVAWDIDWSTVSWHSRDPARMQRMLQTWDEHLSHPALPRTLAARLQEAGFGNIRAAGHTFATAAEASPDRFGTSLIPLVQDFVADRNPISVDDARAWADEQRQLAADGDFFFACIQFCFTATRP
jgi:arsenite methyltransferase